jgi:hypothetical protein
MWGGQFIRDDGTKINPDLIAKPSLCVSCRKDERPDQYVLCVLTRADQQGEREFECDAFEPRTGSASIGM